MRVASSLFFPLPLRFGRSIWSSGWTLSQCLPPCVDCMLDWDLAMCTTDSMASLMESWLENSSWAGTRPVWRFFFPGRSTHFSRTGIWPSNPSSRESGCFLGLPLPLFTMLFPVLACLWSLLTFKILLTWSRFFLVVRILEKAHIFCMSHWISSSSLCLCLLL